MTPAELQEKWVCQTEYDPACQAALLLAGLLYLAGFIQHIEPKDTFGISENCPSLLQVPYYKACHRLGIFCLPHSCQKLFVTLLQCLVVCISFLGSVYSLLVYICCASMLFHISGSFFPPLCLPLDTLTGEQPFFLSQSSFSSTQQLWSSKLPSSRFSTPQSPHQPFSITTGYIILSYVLIVPF